MYNKIAYKQLDRATGRWIQKFKDIAEEFRPKNMNRRVGNPNAMRTVKKETPFLPSIV
jgi:hypothetical protein